jgi:hypothetical protein
MTIALQGDSGETRLWKPTTLAQLGLREIDFEGVLARTPQLLCLEGRDSGIWGPFAVFTQLPLGTPLGRDVNPDITLLTGSGDVVIVEVKRFGNAELKGRQVIAQAVDYASSISALDEMQLARLFNGGEPAHWVDVVRRHFSNENDVEDLAASLLRRASRGEVHVVVACDKVPFGLREMARSISAQSALSFSLQVVEVTPFVPQDGEAESVMFVPAVRLETEVVAKTVITVQTPEGVPLPNVTIETTRIDEIEENLNAVTQEKPRKRSRTDQELEGEVLASDDPTVRDLYHFAKSEGYGGLIQSNSPKVSPTFGFYMHVRLPNGGEGPQQCFYCPLGWNRVVIFIKWDPVTIPPDVLEEFKSDLREVLGDAFNPKALEANVPLDAIGENLDAFKDVIRRLQRRVDPGEISVDLGKV